MRGLFTLALIVLAVVGSNTCAASAAEKSVFDRDPFRNFLDEQRKALDERRKMAEPAPVTQKLPASAEPLANIDQIAVEYDVPANILAAIARLERDETVSQVTANAHRLRKAMSEGRRVEGIVSPEVRVRAAQIGADTYGYLPEAERTKKWLGWYDYFFGYRYAEECAVATSSRDAAGACYALYPSVRKIERAEQSRAKHEGVPVWVPD